MSRIFVIVQPNLFLGGPVIHAPALDQAAYVAQPMIQYILCGLAPQAIDPSINREL
jgi:hypothetical protein